VQSTKKVAKTPKSVLKRVSPKKTPAPQGLLEILQVMHILYQNVKIDLSSIVKIKLLSSTLKIFCGFFHRLSNNNCGLSSVTFVIPIIS
jgi:hypothetical protein